jgi:hypothetical protein
VSLEDDIFQFVKDAAVRDGRSMSGQIRFWITKMKNAEALT